MPGRRPPPAGGDLADPPRDIHVSLGHPVDHALGALIVAADRVAAEEREIDEPVAHRHARVVARRVTGLTDRGDEPYAGAEVTDQVARMESLTQLRTGLGTRL
jgi:hypothetical protein